MFVNTAPGSCAVEVISKDRNISATQTFCVFTAIPTSLTRLPSQSNTHQREITTATGMRSSVIPSLLATWTSRQTTRSHRLTIVLELTDLPPHHCLTYQSPDININVNRLEMVSADVGMLI